jgi:hypothetical protein
MLDGMNKQAVVWSNDITEQDMFVSAYNWFVNLGKGNNRFSGWFFKSPFINLINELIGAEPFFISW